MRHHRTWTMRIFSNDQDGLTIENFHGFYDVIDASEIFGCFLSRCRSLIMTEVGSPALLAMGELRK